MQMPAAVPGEELPYQSYSGGIYERHRLNLNRLIVDDVDMFHDDAAGVAMQRRSGGPY